MHAHGPRDNVLQWSYRSEIWQAFRQHCCRDACQISERLKRSKPDSRCFETSQDLTVRQCNKIPTSVDKWTSAQLYITGDPFHTNWLQAYYIPLGVLSVYFVNIISLSPMKCIAKVHKHLCISYKASAMGYVMSILTHYNGVIMSTMASQIAGGSIVCSIVCSGADQRK